MCTCGCSFYLHYGVGSKATSAQADMQARSGVLHAARVAGMVGIAMTVPNVGPAAA